MTYFLIMKSQTSKIIIKDIAREHRISEDSVNEIIMSQFRKLRLTMTEMNHETREYPVIQLPKWGKFLVTNKRRIKNE